MECKKILKNNNAVNTEYKRNVVSSAFLKSNLFTQPIFYSVRLYERKKCLIEFALKIKKLRAID